MTRKGVIQTLAAFTVAALCFGFFLHSLEPFPSWKARGLGQAIGLGLGLILWSGIVPVVWWGFRKFNASAARPILVTWGILATLFAAVSLVGTLIDREETRTTMFDQIQKPGAGRSDFLAGMTESCVAGQTQSPENQKAGVTQAQIKAYCDCTTEYLAKAITKRELEEYFQTKEAPASYRDKVFSARDTCAPKAFKR